jgi:hypothetical protein
MSRKIIWVFMALLCLGVTAGTTSTYMTDTAANADNLFKVGSLAITLDPTSAAFNVPALSPGQTVESSLEVKNAGTVPCAFTLGARKTAGYSALFDVLTCRVSDRGGAVLFDGGLGSLACAPVPLGAGEAQPLKIAVSLPSAAGNDLVDKYCKVTFDVAAEQPH